MENNEYIRVPDKNVLQAMVASYRGRKQVSTINWVKKCNGQDRNKRAIALAEEGAQKT